MVDREDVPAPEPQRRTANVTTLMFVAVAAFLMILLAFAFASPQRSRPKEGEPAPGFELALFDSSEISLADLRGQVVVLNFWASWCGPCRREAPALQQVWEAYEGQGVVVLGVSYQDAEGASRQFIEQFGLTYANGIDVDGHISRAYGVTGVPETFVIDRQGRVAWFRLGEVTAQDLTEQIEQLQAQ
jgi:cytochrome c biogenesis protein CcmG/thiol:disulfide interchange protein DsbE